MARIAARALLEDEAVLVRNTAAEILGLVGKRQDTRRLRHALGDREWVVRASAAESLGLVGGKRARPGLLEAMRDDTQPIVRREAARALAHAGEAAIVPLLEDALAHEETEQARVGLLAGLYALGQRERLPSLLTLLRSDDYQVRYCAMNSVEEVVLPDDRAEAAASLREMLAAEPSQSLRVDAARAVERLQGQRPARAQDGGCRPVRSGQTRQARHSAQSKNRRSSSDR